jgi:AcrR family transcriptional regulator
MTTHTPEPGLISTPHPAGATSGPRRRDAATTRQLLLDAARRRFATDGYAATFVRDIANDAGVNVALINRYFTSKEGLFRACLLGAVDDLRRTVADDLTLDEMPYVMARQLADSETGKYPNQLLLLLRSSGDERADHIRRDILQSFAEVLASVAGRQPGDDDQVVLNSQVILATAFGIAILRSAGLQPLSSADQHQLAEPLRQVIDALLAQK